MINAPPLPYNAWSRLLTALAGAIKEPFGRKYCQQCGIPVEIPGAHCRVCKDLRDALENNSYWRGRQLDWEEEEKRKQKIGRNS